MSKITVTTIAGLTSGGDANKVKIESGDTLQVESNATVGGTLGVTGAITGTSQTLTKSGNVALYLNRTGSGTDDDGDIVQISNADGLVGAIGSSSNTEITFAGKDCGLGVLDHALVPTQGDGLLYRNDNEVDLGRTDTRFKDIYISGGLYVGGTGAANKLDDYEEGTWTPTFPAGVTVGTIYLAEYTKVGRMVYVGAYFVVSAITNNSSTFVIGGLPFTVKASNYHGAGSITYTKDFSWNSTGAFQAPTPQQGNTQVYFHRSDGTAATVLQSGVQGLISKEFIFATVYLTD